MSKDRQERLKTIIGISAIKQGQTYMKKDDPEGRSHSLASLILTDIASGLPYSYARRLLGLAKSISTKSKND